MRKRKRRDTVIRQYKYRISTHEWPLPPEVWNIGRRMQQAWNALVLLYEGSALQLLNRDYDEAWEQLKRDKDETGYKATKRTLDQRKRDTWLEWDKAARKAISPFGLDYSQAPNVIERFNAGIKAGRTLQQRDPDQLTAIQIPLTFPGSAAIRVSDLMKADGRRRWRLIFEGYDESAYEDNSSRNRRRRRQVYLALGLSRNVTVECRIDLHRPLPEDGLIKRVLLTGVRRPFAGWRWHVLFQVEQPIRVIQPETTSAVWLRIGWARHEEGIVVARWKDECAEGALLLPLRPSNRKDRHTEAFHQRLVERHGAAEWPHRLRDYRELRAYKAEERELDGESRMLMRARRRRVEERWQARRRDLYRKFAHWLVHRYETIYLPELSIKSMAEAEKEGVLAAADRWRQIAAPGDLLAIIKDAAEKVGRRIEKHKQSELVLGSLESATWFAEPRGPLANGAVRSTETAA